jgi:hypothetical protein
MTRDHPVSRARDEFVESIARGRRAWTPVAVIVAVLAVIAIVGGIVLIACLAIWFA